MGSLKDLILKHIDINGLLKELVTAHLGPYLREKAAKTGNKWDDTVVETLLKILGDNDAASNLAALKDDSKKDEAKVANPGANV